MLKKEVLKKLAGLLKIEEADLDKAITDEKEVDLKIPVLDDAAKAEIFTETELKTLKDNEYKNGKEKGTEMAVKEVKEELKLDFTGKTIKGLLEASNKKALEDAKIEPEKKVKDLQDKLATVQGTVADYEKKLADRETEIKAVKRKSELAKHIPARGEKDPALDNDDIIAKMERNGFEFVEDEKGVITASKAGKALTDKVGNALPLADVFSGFMLENKFISVAPNTGGRGGQGAKPSGGKPTKLSELKAEFKEQGKSELGEEFMKAATALKAENPEFDMAT